MILLFETYLYFSQQPSATRGKMAEEYSKAERQERVLENTEYVSLSVSQ